MARRAKLRAIDRGTRYDISGEMRGLVRRIESGEIKPRDVVILTREPIAPEVSCRVMMYHMGTGSTEDIHWMLSTAKSRVEPR